MKYHILGNIYIYIYIVRLESELQAGTWWGEKPRFYVQSSDLNSWSLQVWKQELLRIAVSSLMWPPVPPQRSLTAPAVVNTSWTSSSWRCWTDTGTPSASSAPTARLRWRTNVSPEPEASTARTTSSSQFRIASFFSSSVMKLYMCLLLTCLSYRTHFANI